MLTTENNQPENASSPVIAPGVLLTQGRESADLTQAQVAKELHMPLIRVRALEVDDYANVGGDTFVRGYLRSYAKLLNLDVLPIISAYEKHAAMQGLAVEAYVPVGKDSSPKKLWGFVALLALFLAGLWLISVWFFNNQAARPVVIAPLVVEQAQTPVTEKPVVSSVSDDDHSAIDQSENSAEENTAVQLEASEETVPVANAVQVLDKLYFTFSDECWLEVSDAQGDVLATELQRAGSNLSLEGIAPFTVKLGNARVASLTLNGSAVTITPPVGAKVMSLSVGN